MGPDLEIVVLDMTLQEQKERVSAIHGGSEEVVDVMKVSEEGTDDKGSEYEDEDDKVGDDDTVVVYRQSTPMCEPAGSDEPHTARLVVSQEMTRRMSSPGLWTCSRTNPLRTSE